MASAPESSSSKVLTGNAAPLRSSSELQSDNAAPLVSSLEVQTELSSLSLESGSILHMSTLSSTAFLVQRFRFMDLPLELRLKIYPFALGGLGVCTLRPFKVLAMREDLTGILGPSAGEGENQIYQHTAAAEESICRSDINILPKKLLSLFCTSDRLHSILNKLSAHDKKASMNVDGYQRSPSHASPALDSKGIKAMCLPEVPRYRWLVALSQSSLGFF